MNIPLYRAKKVNSDEYIEGYYYPIRCIGTDKTSPSIASPDLEDPEYDDYFDIDPSTLSINFPDMIDSKGTKIFASLSEEYKGGDILTSDLGVPFNTLMYKGVFKIRNGNSAWALSEMNKQRTFKVTGIQE
jgi:hypothetical protein